MIIVIIYSFCKVVPTRFFAAGLFVPGFVSRRPGNFGDKFVIPRDSLEKSFVEANQKIEFCQSSFF